MDASNTRDAGYSIWLPSAVRPVEKNGILPLGCRIDANWKVVAVSLFVDFVLFCLANGLAICLV